MPKRILFRVNHTLERCFPERRLFLKSETETRFVRLRPATQVAALAGGVLLFGWTVLATSILMIDSIGSASTREQALREQIVFEQRLDALSRERDERAEEALQAQERFNMALGKVSQMQTLLLTSEDRRREVETGLEVVQRTLRRAIRERDQARAEVEDLRRSLAEQGGEGSPLLARAQETEATLDMLSEALAAVAEERDSMAFAALQSKAEAQEIALDLQLMQERNHEIFTRIEEAVTVSMEPLDRMFRNAGLRPEDVLREVRRGYSGTGGPVGALRFSTKGDIHPDETRADAILAGLDQMSLYRLAVQKVPFANPVRGAFRFTSGFGYRRDPKGGGTRMHSGTDFAGARGTAIHATAGGLVKKAGWHSGYGNTVIIQHAFGIETLYAHLSQIRVREGQSVSRGDRIGDMGSTGRSTGVHLHYEVRVGGNAVNPMTYIRAANNVF
ncbi:MAG: DUF5930 domain-containing protein [Gemmobacter sp.]